MKARRHGGTEARRGLGGVRFRGRCVVVPFLAAILLGLPAACSAERPTRDASFNGFSFRATFDGDRVVLRRDGMRVFDIVLGDKNVKRVEHRNEARDHQIGLYTLPAIEQKATVTVSRLTPAVLIDSPGRSVSFKTDGPDPAAVAFAGKEPGPFNPEHGVGPQAVAFLTLNGSVVYRKEELETLSEVDFELQHPWVLAWFGEASPWRKPWLGPATRDNSDDENADFRRPRPTDMPILFRLERRPTAIRQDGNGIRFEFKDKVGRLAVMPAMGAHITDPELSEVWRRMPRPPLRKNAYTWSDVLRDFPLSVRESVDVDINEDHVTFKQSFTRSPFQDKAFRDVSERDRYAPLPPMLATAIGSQSKATGDAGLFGGPTEVDADFNFLTVREGATKRTGLQLTVWRGDKLNEQVDGLLDGNLMDTPGQSRLVEGGDYAFRIGRLKQYLRRQPRNAPAKHLPQDDALRDMLASSIENWINGVEVAPLLPRLLIYKATDSGRPMYRFDTQNASDLAATIHAAMPYLPIDLQAKAKRHLRSAWQLRPPWKWDPRVYRGAATSLLVEIDSIALHEAMRIARERQITRRFADLYGMAAYHDLIGELPDADGVRSVARNIANQLLSDEDWALMIPTASGNQSTQRRTATVVGPANVNGWLKGAIGLARLAQAYGWAEEEQLAWRLFAKLAVARIGMARYVEEQHHMGVMHGRPVDDVRSFPPIGPRMNATVHPNASFQPAPSPYEDLTPEVGQLLADHARESNRIWLDHLDREKPRWWVIDTREPLRAGEPRSIVGNVLAHAFILGKRGQSFQTYITKPNHRYDLYHIAVLVAAIEAAGRGESGAGAD